MRPHRKYLIRILFYLLLVSCVNAYAEPLDISAVRTQPRTYEDEFDRAPKSPHSLSGHLVVSAGAVQSYRTKKSAFRKDVAWGISGSVEFYFFDFISLGLGLRRVNSATFELNQDSPKDKRTFGVLFTRIKLLPGSRMSPYIRLGAGVAGESKASYIIEALGNPSSVIRIPVRNWTGFVGQVEAGLSFHLKSRLWARGGLVYTVLTTLKNDIFVTPPLPFESQVLRGGDDIDTIDWRLELALAL
ncbi:MAG: hypothetical protein IIB00_05680 [candidate division Zixibacteria bacterium]|nr:hypothetical protein [candidate division Zixibacteria bacterium]